MQTYTLNEDKIPVPCSSEQWTKDREDGSFKILQTQLDERNFVSTVFLGMDHVGGMFETMIFCDDVSMNGEMLRCEAITSCPRQHQELVMRLWNARL